MTTTARRLVSAAALVFAAAALRFVYLFDPAKTALLPACPFYWAIGCYCPGCGTLRALHQLLRGHPLAALDLNPLMVLSVPLLAAYAAALARLELTGARSRQGPVPAWLVWALLVFVLLYSVLRNLPIFPLTYLAP